MPIRSAVISVGSNPKALASNSMPTAAARVIVHNMGGAASGIVYIGDEEVTVSSGVALASNATPLTINTAGGTVYAISQTEYQTVRILEEY